MPQIAISVEGLTKDFGSVRAVDDLSFTVREGTIAGFLGPNGSGKTTTLRAVLGLVRPTSGQALIDGRPYVRLDAPSRHVGAVLDARAFHPGRSARNHLRAVAIEARVARSRVDEVLDLVGLTDAADRRAGGFSLGMGQRLALGAALLGDPRVLILDEPANGLDPEGIRWLRGFLRTLAAEGHTVLVSSHGLAEIEQTVDEVIIIKDGHLVTQAPIAELADRAGQRVMVRSPQSDELALRLIAAGARIESSDDDVLTVVGVSPEAIGDLAADQRIPLYGLTDDASRLEDVFFHLTTLPGDAAMTALISAELFRLRTIRSPSFIAAGVLALVAFLAITPVFDADTTTGPDVIQLLQITGGVVAAIGVALLAAATAGGDFRRGTAVLGYLASPRRGYTLTARAVTYAGLGAAFGLLASTVAMAIALPAADGAGIDVSLSGGDLAQLLGGAAAGGALFATAGVLLGTATRNPTTAVVAILVWQPAESLIGMLGIGEYLPFSLLQTMLGHDSAVAPLAAAALLAALSRGPCLSRPPPCAPARHHLMTGTPTRDHHATPPWRSARPRPGPRPSSWAPSLA